MRVLFFILTASTALAANLPPDHAKRMERGLKLFDSEVASLLKQNCLKCHGGEKVKSDFDMATREDLLRGGSHGSVVVPFDAKGSLLMALIRHEKEPMMPDSSPKLPEAVISKIAAWIDDGAPYSAPLIAGKSRKRTPAW